MPSSHFHGLDVGSVTVLIRDYPWDIRPGSVDMTVIFRDVPASTIALPPFCFFRGAIFNIHGMHRIDYGYATVVSR